MSKNLVANKFLVTSEKRLVFGEYLYRIQAVKDFERIDGVKVKSGDFGGFIQSPENLSQDGLAWIDKDSYALRSSKVQGNALLLNNSLINHSAIITDNAISIGSKINDKAKVGDFTQLLYSTISNDCELLGKSEIKNSFIGDNAVINGDGVVIQDSKVFDKATIKDKAQLIDNIVAMDNAIICGDTTLRNHIVVCGDVFIKTRIFDFGEFLVKNETNNEIKKIRLNKSALQWYFDIQKAVKILISQGIEAKMDISSDGASYNFNVVITLKNNLNIRVDKGSIADLAKIG